MKLRKEIEKEKKSQGETSEILKIQMTVKILITDTIYWVLAIRLLLCVLILCLPFNPQNNSMMKFLLSLFMYEDTDEPKELGKYFSHILRNRYSHSRALAVTHYPFWTSWSPVIGLAQSMPFVYNIIF